MSSWDGAWVAIGVLGGSSPHPSSENLEGCKGEKCPGFNTGELLLLFSSDPRDAIKELLEGISRTGEYSWLLLRGSGSGVAVIYKLSHS